MGEQNLERRVLPIGQAEMNVRQTEDGERRLEGRAIPFNSESRDLGGFREVFEPGAFDNALTDSDILATFNHDRSKLLGTERAGTLRIRQTEGGLDYSVDLPDTETAREVHTLTSRGDLAGSSITFKVREGADEIRTTQDGGLLRIIPRGAVERVGDVGPVSEPAYEMTQVSARSLERAREALEEAEGSDGEDEGQRADQIRQLDHEDLQRRRRLLAEE